MRRLNDNSLFSVIHDYLNIWLPMQRNYSEHTIRAYATTLDQLLDFAKNQAKVKLNKVAFESLTADIVRKYLDFCEKERGCAISTRNHRLKCIKAFYKYAASRDIALVAFQKLISAIRDKKSVKEDTVDYISESAIKTVLSTPGTNRRGVRDRFLLILMYDAAARIQEILDLKVCDIKYGTLPTVTLCGKGGKTRTVPITEETYKHFEYYLTLYHPGVDKYSSTPLFYTIQNKTQHKMSADNVRKFLSRYAEQAKAVCPDVPDNLHCHQFRHSRAMHLYQHGMDLSIISQWLGHSQIETTLVYARADTEMKRKAIASATTHSNPLADKAANAQRFIVDDDDTLRALVGLKR